MINIYFKISYSMIQNLIDVNLIQKVHKLDLLKQFLPNIKFPEEIKIEN